MIVLDTNVLSALMLVDRDVAVVSWLNRQAADSVWTTSITVFEIRLGLGLLPSGKRRSGLEDAFSLTVTKDLEGRVLSFEEEAARHAADFAARRRLVGRPIDFRDVEIAGIVASKRAILATANTRDFEGLGLKLANPWRDEES